MRRIAHIFAALFLLCTGVWAEVISIDFNRGTLMLGMSISTAVKPTTNPQLFCNYGAQFVNLHSNTRNCFYNDKGCGIRIGSADGDGWFILHLADTAVYVSKVVIYASKLPGNALSQLTIKGGSVFEYTISNSELSDFSESFPASEHYVLPEVVVGQSFVNLRIDAPKQGYAVLHRIDIYTGSDSDVDAIQSPAVSVDEMGDFCNLSGQRTSKPLHGIYIKGGKKYVFCR